MVPFERLGVVPVVLAAGSIPDMPDCRPAGILLHQTLVLAAVAHAKYFADTAHVLVRLQQLLAVGIEGCNSCRELAAVLDVQQHPRHKARNFIGPLRRAKRTGVAIRQVIDRGQTAFVMQFAHGRAQKTCISTVDRQLYVSGAISSTEAQLVSQLIGTSDRKHLCPTFWTEYPILHSACGAGGQ